MHDGYCWLCGRWGHLEEHHIFGGANRKKSTRYGLTVFLCGDRLLLHKALHIVFFPYFKGLKIPR